LPGEVRVDWLQFTVWGASDEEVRKVVGEFVCTDWTQCAGNYGYPSGWVGSGGSRILYGAKDERQGVHVVIPGRALSELSESDVRGLLSYVRSKGRPSRVDIACDFRPDDAGRLVSPSDVREADLRGETVTRVKIRTWLESRRGASYSGSTYSFGRRGAPRYLRVYDKGAQKGNGERLTRWELECRDESADAIVTSLLGGPWGEAFGSWLVGFVDFRTVNGKRSNRRERAPWFERLVGEARAARVGVHLPEESLEAMRRWLRVQVAPTLALVWTVDGGEAEYLTDLARQGREKWTKRHVELMYKEGLKVA